MIYVKIYLDRNSDGKEHLVIDSAKQSSHDGYLTLAGRQCGNRILTKTHIFDVSHIAISPEAKLLFHKLLMAATPVFFEGDLELIGCRDTQHGWDSGMFAYLPLPNEAGNTRRILYPDEPLTVITQVGFSPNALDCMTPYPNDKLKALDLSAPKESL